MNLPSSGNVCFVVGSRPGAFNWVGSHVSGRTLTPMYCIRARPLLNYFWFVGFTRRWIFSFCMIVIVPSSLRLTKILLIVADVPLTISFSFLDWNFFEALSSSPMNFLVPSPRLSSTSWSIDPCIYPVALFLRHDARVCACPFHPQLLLVVSHICQVPMEPWLGYSVQRLQNLPYNVDIKSELLGWSNEDVSWKRRTKEWLSIGPRVP